MQIALVGLRLRAAEYMSPLYDYFGGASRFPCGRILDWKFVGWAAHDQHVRVVTVCGGYLGGVVD